MAEEKLNKEIRVVLPPSLYDEFKKKCKVNYKTISEVIRDMIFSYVKSSPEK